MVWSASQPHRILGLFPTTKVTIRDPRVRKELLGRVGGALRNPPGQSRPGRCRAGGHRCRRRPQLVLDRRTRRTAKRRIRELTELSGPVGPALRKSLQAAEAAAG